jgi:replicative DNA helicase
MFDPFVPKRDLQYYWKCTYLTRLGDDVCDFLVALRKPALLVVDYVQLLRDEEGDGRMRERNVSAAARGLKDVSGELGVPVLALVQLNRNRATRSDKRPQLADLRESGDLENTADSVLGLYREEIDNPHTNDRGLAELSVLKKRQPGEEVGTMRKLVWVGESYRDLART